HEPPRLAQPDRRREARDGDQPLERPGRQRVSAKAAHVAPPDHEVVQPRAELVVEVHMGCRLRLPAKWRLVRDPRPDRPHPARVPLHTHAYPPPTLPPPPRPPTPPSPRPPPPRLGRPCPPPPIRPTRSPASSSPIRPSCTSRPRSAAIQSVTMSGARSPASC